MLIIDVNSESIDRALKKYKRKVDKTGMIKELRRRKQFTKPSIDKRVQVLKAAYRLKKYGSH